MDKDVVCMYIYIYIYTHTHTYTHTQLSQRKERNFVIYNNMDGPRDSHTKQSKSDRER